MTRKEIDAKYGKTKLDHALSYMCMAFEKILELCAWLVIPLGVTQQVVIYGESHPNQVLPIIAVLMVLMSVGAAYEIDKLIKKHKGENK